MRHGIVSALLPAVVAALGIASATAAPATDAACRAPHLALAIGNARYTDGALSGPEGDAKAIAGAFGALGFAAKEGENLTHDAMRAALDDLLSKVRRDAVVALFFSGYGIQAADHTYLLPVDATIRSEADVKVAGFDLDRIMADVADRGGRLRLVIVDAARDNPFERGFRPGGPAGLAAIAGTPGIVALYAAVPGAISAATGVGESSMTNALVTELRRPGAMAEDSFRRARQDTVRTSHGEQTPWLSSFLDQDVALAAKDCGPAPLAVAEAPPTTVTAPAAPPPVIEPPRPPAPAPATPDPVPQAAEVPAPAAAPQVTPPHVAAVTAPPAATVAPVAPPVAADDGAVGDPARLREIADRLFDQGLDPGDPGSPAMTAAIRTFEERAGLPVADAPTALLLARLRATPAPSPWGAIVFARHDRRWGMSWSGATRRVALADAKRRCGSADCNDASTFADHRCGAFALSPVSWSITWREDASGAQEAALDLCGRRGTTCHIVGAVCADGSGHVSPTSNDRAAP